MAFTECGSDDEYAFFSRHFEFARGDFKTESGIASMDFSAFLGPPMQKKDVQPTLRTVDESPEGEILSAEGESVAGNEEKVRLEVKDRNELKFKTHKPKLDERVEREEVTLEDEWNTEKKPTRLHLGFWIPIGLVFLAGMVWLVFEITQLKQEDIREQVDLVSLKEREEQAKRLERAEQDALQTIETIKNVVRQFYGSGSVDEALQTVRHAERVRPMMEVHYSEKAMERCEVVSFVDMSRLTIESRGGFWVVLTILSSGAEGKLVVEVSSPSDVKVDWETHVCAQPMDWERFVKDRPARYRGDFRVYAEFDNFYNYEFADSGKYQAFKLTALNSYEVIYGYAPRDGQTFRVIDELIRQNGNQKVPVMLRLYLQEGLQLKSGVLIEQIVAPRWLLLDSPEVNK